METEESSKENASKAMEHFGRFCEFSANGCPCEVGSQEPFVLFTNVWNEEEYIRDHFRRIAEQPYLPDLWVWLDDGSTDSSYEEMVKASEDYPIEVIIVRNKRKEEANYLMLGKGHQLRLDRTRELITERKMRYMTNVDVDTIICPNYFGRMLWLMKKESDLGVVAGYPVGEWKDRVAREPQHSGKFIRWSIVKRIEKLWDTCPDTMYNIKARKYGYETQVVKVPMYHQGPTAGLTKAGAERIGRIAYYAGRPFWAALLRSLRRALIGKYGTAMLRGHISEWIRGTWHCEDPDIREHFNESILDTILTYIKGKRRRTKE